VTALDEAAAELKAALEAIPAVEWRQGSVWTDCVLRPPLDANEADEFAGGWAGERVIFRANQHFEDEGRAHIRAVVLLRNLAPLLIAEREEREKQLRRFAAQIVAHEKEPGSCGAIDQAVFAEARRVLGEGR